jgi:hypothetical protein
MTQRTLSFTEIDTALTCWARLRWDMAYGGRLAGSTLKPRLLAPILSGGRAWGAAVAQWHASAGTLLASFQAREALHASLLADEAEMRGRGEAPLFGDRIDLEQRLNAVLDHYMATVQPFSNLTRLEEEVLVPIRARGDLLRPSSRYKFLYLPDGYTIDEDGRPWLVEFKLRGTLTDVRLIQRSRQWRWGAWALEQQIGEPPVGIYVDERLNEPPKLPRLVRAARKGQGIDGRMPSHDKSQLITSREYRDLCAEFEVDPSDEALTAFDARVWQQRVPVILRPSEIAEAGAELRDAAKLIRDLDSGSLMPIRNAKRGNCGYCKFNAVCDAPDDSYYVETLFERTVPKRLRGPRREAPA